MSTEQATRERGRTLAFAGLGPAIPQVNLRRVDASASKHAPTGRYAPTDGPVTTTATTATTATATVTATITVTIIAVVLQGPTALACQAPTSAIPERSSP
jgi:hypothetical protein